jgi:hypothetical protein
MNAEEAIIRKLCMDCERRKNVCGKYPPSYEDAHRCMWDKAQRVFEDMDKAFTVSPTGGKIG